MHTRPTDLHRASDRGGLCAWFFANPANAAVVCVGRPAASIRRLASRAGSPAPCIGLSRPSPHWRATVAKAPMPRFRFSSRARIPSELSPHDGRTLAQRTEFGEGDRTWEVLHAAVGRRDQLVRTDEF